MITTPEQMREAAAQIAEKQQVYQAHVCAARIRAIPIAPQPATDWTACAADMLRVWDTWFGGSAGGDDAAARKLSIASAFAAQAFEHAASSGITADGAPAALLRAFLLALIDKLHPDLDYLRADPASGEKARADRGAVTLPVAAAPQPVAVTVKPLVWEKMLWSSDFPEEHRANTAIGMFRVKADGGNAFYCQFWGDPIRFQDGESAGKLCVFHTIELAKAAAQADYEARILSALTIQPADPLSDPRVVALVEAAGKLLHSVCGPTGFVEAVRDDSGYAYPWPSLDDAERALDAALRAIGGEA